MANFHIKELRKVLMLLSLIGINAITFGQKDSLKINGEIGLRGKWQTGNFAQFVINPNARITLEKKQNSIELRANYEFLKVNNGNLINDFWSYGVYQYRSDNFFFPMVMMHYGFAQAYAIDNSLIGGIGTGINLLKNLEHNYLQANVYAGYLNLKYENTDVHKAASLGSYIKLKFPIKEDLIYFLLSSHAYISLKNTDFRSFNSRMILAFRAIKNIGINLTYSLVYNNNNPSVTEKINGKLIFGFNYSYK